MKFLKKRRKIYGKRAGIHEEDPLAAVANLFDVAMVFAVGLMVALLTTFHLQELLLPDSEFTLIKNPGQADMKIITKQGKEIKVKRLTEDIAEGRGIRLGTAYRLEDGRVIYVPEE